MEPPADESINTGNPIAAGHLDTDDLQRLNQLTTDIVFPQHKGIRLNSLPHKGVPKCARGKHR